MEKEFNLNLFIVTILGIIFIITPVLAKEKMRVAILDFSAENVQKTYSKAVRNVFEVSLYKTEVFDILERNQIKNILKEHSLQMAGCTDTSCAVKIGQILSADMVVFGSLNRIGKYTITVKFVNVRRGRIALADYETADTEEDIQSVVNTLAQRMAEKVTSKMKDKPRIAEAEKKAIKKMQPIKSSSVRNININMYVLGSYIIPQGKFNELVEAGNGATASITVENIILRNVFIGIESGYWEFTGKSEIIEKCSMIPILGLVGLRLNIFNWLYIAPYIGVGVSYNSMICDKDGFAVGEDPEYTKESRTESVAKAGINLGLLITGNLPLQFGVEYGSIFEEDERLDFFTINAGIGIRF